MTVSGRQPPVAGILTVDFILRCGNPAVVGHNRPLVIRSEFLPLTALDGWFTVVKLSSDLACPGQEWTVGQ
jgi:hypothetical protein